MSDIVINGVTYPEPKRVAFPGSDGKPVVFELPTDAEAELNGVSTRPPQTKIVYEAVESLRQQLTTPFNTKGTVATLAELPTTGNELNDTYYVQAEKYRVTWTGTQWVQSSMSETEYESELSAMGDELGNLKDTNSVNVLKPWPSGTRTNYGVTCVSDGEGNYVLNGTATAAAFFDLIAKNAAPPADIVRGMDHYVVLNTTAPVAIRFYCYDSNDAAIPFQNGGNLYERATNGWVHIPDNMASMIMRFQIAKGAVLNNVQITPKLLTAMSNLILREKIQDLNVTLDEAVAYNGVDLVKYYRSKGKNITTPNGISYTWNADGSCTIQGTATANSFCGIITFQTVGLPAGLVPGGTYRLDFHGGSVPVRVYYYFNNSASDSTYKDYTESATLVFPSDMTGIVIRFQIANGTTVDTTVRYTMTRLPSQSADGMLNSVDSDTADETGKTDRTAEIQAALNETGYCKLGPGIFYVSGGIDMPPHSTLEGCGDRTKIRLLASSSSGYVVKMQQTGTLQNLAFSGSPTQTTPTANGGRDAIRFAANYDGSGSGDATSTTNCMISNVWIRNFSGSGIYCHNTSINYAKGLYASNVYIAYCYAGINIDYYSEFNKFTNVCVAWCYYACVNNSGNNVFTACTFHATNTGFLLDGSKPNSAHGTLNGCTFCHIGSNAGSAITINGASSGFIISACQFWYNSISVSDSAGIVFDGCCFGRGTTSGRGAKITVSGGGTVLFTGCSFQSDETYPPEITVQNNTKVRFNACYGSESGNEITA